MTYNDPSRVAIEKDGDAWVANRALTNGQPNQSSVTKISSELTRCEEKNGIPGIQTSTDANEDGIIDVNDPTEFFGLDDECVMHTTNVGGDYYVTRSMDIDNDGNIWLGTFSTDPNYIYKISPNGKTITTVKDNLQIKSFNLIIDKSGILWTNELNLNTDGKLYYLNTVTNETGSIITNPFNSSLHHHIIVDKNNNLWISGFNTGIIYCYKPDRSSFSSLQNGDWIKIDLNSQFSSGEFRGIATDRKGNLLITSTYIGGYICRLPLSIVNGKNNMDIITITSSTSGFNYQKLTNSTGFEYTYGVAPDFNGNIWVVNSGSTYITRLKIDKNGVLHKDINIEIPTGNYPYTYSDFTGYWKVDSREGYSQSGTYRHILASDDSAEKRIWKSIEWSADTPTDTKISLYIRKGNSPSEVDSSSWLGPVATGTTDISSLTGNSAYRYLELKFQFTSNGDNTPVLKTAKVSWQSE